MNAQFKLLIDENIGLPIGKALVHLLSFHPDAPQIEFVVEKFGSGTKDHIWIPQIAKEGSLILSTDRSKRCGGAKLHMVCAEYGVTHCLISTTIHEMKQFEKALIILNVWQDLAKLAAAPAGSRHRLFMQSGKPVVTPFEKASKLPRVIPFHETKAEKNPSKPAEGNQS